MPDVQTDLFDRVELTARKIGKLCKYLKYRLKLTIKINLQGRYLEKNRIKSQCIHHLQRTLSSYFLIVGTQPSDLPLDQNEGVQNLGNCLI